MMAALQGKIIEFLWWMKKQGYKETTIKGKGKRLMRLLRLGANLLDPESVKEVLAKTIEQAAELIEASFEHVCEIDGVKLFRKRK